MSESLVIEVAEDGASFLRAGLVSEAGSWLQAVPIGALDQHAGKSASLVLHGALVTTHRLPVPDFPDGKLMKILPGLLDDRLSTSGETRHFAPLGPRGVEDGQRTIAVVGAELLTSVIAMARDLGLEVRRVVPDYALLEAGSAAAIDGRICAHVADSMGFAAENSLAEHMLPPEMKPETASAEAWQAVLATASGVGVTLMQGAYGARGDMLGGLVWFRRAGMLGAASFAIWLGLSLYQASSNHDRADALHARAEQAFREALPEVPRIVNMEAQMRRALMAMRQQGGGEFLNLSAQAVAAVAANDNTMVESLRFDAETGALVLSVSFASFADGESFKQRLQQDGLRVVEGGSRTEGSRVVSELTIGRAS